MQLHGLLRRRRTPTKEAYLRRRVDFVIAGAQKCATTSLYKYLNQHPAIVGSDPKEVDFFNYDGHYAKGTQWYHTAFERNYKAGARLKFEASVDYMYLPICAERMYRYNEDMKVIIVVRDPVLRAFSAYTMYRWYNENPIRVAPYLDRLMNQEPALRSQMTAALMTRPFPTFSEAIRREADAIIDGAGFVYEPSFLRRGLYARQVERLLEFIPGQNILLISSEHLRMRRLKTLGTVMSFLEVGQIDWSRTDLEEEFASEYSEAMADPDAAFLKDFFEPFNSDLRVLLGREPW